MGVTTRYAEPAPTDLQANSSLAIEFQAAESHAQAGAGGGPVRSPAGRLSPSGRSCDIVASLVDPVFGSSPARQALEREAGRAAATGHHVLVLGERGAGRRALARWLHARGPWRNRPLAEVPCASLTEQQLDATLFGYGAGAFEGALRPRPGLVELADGGALLLADVQTLPAPIQARLLGLLEAGRFRRHGELRSRRLQLQLLATACPALPLLARQGHFREALYYRLAAITLVLPS